ALFKYPSSVIQRASVEAAKAGPGGSTAVNVPGVMLQDMHDAWVEQMDRVGRAKNAWDEQPSLECLARFSGQAGAAAMPGFTGPVGVAVGAMVGATEEESEQTGDPYTALGHYAAAVTFMAGPKVSKPIGKVVGRAAEVAGEIKKGGVRAGLQTITGTGPRLIEQAEEARTAKVTKQEAGYQEDLQKAQAKQEQLAEKIRTKHEAKVQVIKQKYAEEVRRANQQKLEKSKAEAKRTALERYTSRLAEAWDENVKNTHRAVRAWLDTRWNDLRAKIEGAKASVDLTPVQQAVLHAQNSILRGSREKIAIFNSILKEGNPLEDASVFQGAGASAR